MTPEEYEAAGKIYREAKRLEDAARAEYLDGACRADARLRAIVESWLATDTNTIEVTPGPRANSTPIPEHIGEFEVLGLLGRGGMGEVYLARQRSPDRRVAIKTLDPETSMSRTSVARFEAEAEYLAKLHHDNIAQVYATGQRPTEHGPMPYLVMEWIEGGRSLTGYADAAGLGFAQRLAIFLQVAGAVAHAHQRGVIHRDLKPSNVLVTPDGRCKVLDFGVARALESHRANPGDLTRRGELIGTLPYMSPEQAQGRTDEIDVRTDVYALGVILFELVAGRLPFELPADRYEAVEMIVTALPPRLNTIRDVPRDLAAVVDAALAKAKERRYDSVAAFADDVRRVLENRPVSTRPVSTWERGVYFVRRRKAVASAIAALVLGVVGSVSLGMKAWVADRTAQAREREANVAKRERDALQVAAVFRLGEQLAREGDWGTAMKQYAEALEDGYPDRIEVQLAMVEALEGTGDVLGARRIIESLSGPGLDLGKHRARVLLFQADQTKLPRSRFAPFQGDALLDEAIRLGTLSSADAAYAAALRSDNAKDQIRLLQDALRFDSHHRRANEMIAPTLLVSGHPQEALVAATEFRRLYPDDPAAQIIQLGVRAILGHPLAEDTIEQYPAIPAELIATLQSLVIARHVFRNSTEFLIRELQKEPLGLPPAGELERLGVASGFAAMALAPAPTNEMFEAAFRVPPRLSETWLEVVAGLPAIMFGRGGSAKALDSLSRAMTNNDDACIAFCAGVQRVLLDPEDPSPWKDFALAVERESWLDVRKASLTMVVLASRRHPEAVPPDVAPRAIEQLVREFECTELDFNFLWHASVELGKPAENVCGDVFFRWRAAFPTDPNLAKAEAWWRSQ